MMHRVIDGLEQAVRLFFLLESSVGRDISEIDYLTLFFIEDQVRAFDNNGSALPLLYFARLSRRLKVKVMHEVGLNCVYTSNLSL